ncbi:MAG: choice-of-anchor D domain-containing protein [Acidobacteria bacterium]|nr:choice-of-anchor D domain-containing protein [Acidobacteriota bacterium]
MPLLKTNRNALLRMLLVIGMFGGMIWGTSPNLQSATKTQQLPCVFTASGYLDCLSEVDPNDPLNEKIPLILIHGINPESVPSPPDYTCWDNFRSYFNLLSPSLKSKYKLYKFEYYSNDVSIFDLGGKLRDVLDIQNSRDPNFSNKSIVIIGHSMGGLVARSFIQQHWQQQGIFGGKRGGERVLKLITLGTPHHGSPMSNGEARDQKAGFSWGNILNLFDNSYYSPIGPKYYQLNRSNLYWDNYDGLLNYSIYPNERNDWLATELNSDSTFDNKIIAYAGSFPTPSCVSCCTNKYCLGNSILSGVFNLQSDGIVPISSALFHTQNGEPRVVWRFFSEYNHSEIVAGKGDNILFDKIKLDLEAIQPATLPSAPVLSSPGTSSSPGPVISTTTPTFQWQPVPSAQNYGLYIRQLNSDGSLGPLVFDSEVNWGPISGSIFSLPSSFALVDGRRYRWDMRSRNTAGWGNLTSEFYFQINTGTGNGGCLVTPLTVPTTIPGSLSSSDCSFSSGRAPGSYYDQYSFNGVSGQQVTISLNAGWDTFLILNGPNATEVAYNDDSNETLNSRITVGLTLTGTYTIQATSYNSATTGSYTLSISTSGSGGGCNYSLSPTNSSIGSGGGTGSISVTAGTGCNWTASSNVGWMTVTSGFSGSGNGSVTYSVSGNSSSARTGTLTIAGQIFTVQQNGNSNGGVGIEFNRTSVNFGTVPVGNTPTESILITNPLSSTGTLTVTVGTLSPPFAVGLNSGIHTLGPGQSLPVNITFTPTSSANFSGNLVVTHNAPGGSTNVPISGTGQALTVGISVSPNPVVFSNVSIGDAQTITLTISNPSTSSGNLNGTVSNLSAPFQVCCNTTFAIGPGGSFPISIRFLPTIAGTFNQTLAITHNATNQPQPLQIPVSGTGVSSQGGGCPPIPLNMSQTVNGVLSPTDCVFSGTTQYLDIYSFSGSVGQQITITLTSSAFDAYLYLLPAVNGMVLAQDDDSAGEGGARIIYTLSSTGTFVIYATSYSANQLGNYTLSLTNSGGGGGCNYSISPTSSSIGAGGGTGTLSVTTGAGCSWSASSNVSWITITSGFSGSGNGSVAYSVSNNSSSSRTGTLIIAGRTFTLSQLAGASGENGCEVPVTISIEQTVTTTLNSDCVYTNTHQNIDTYRFSGSGGQTVTITMSSSAFDTYLYLLDGSRNTLQSNDDANGTTNSQITYTLPYSGTFNIDATSLNEYATGQYTLTLTSGGGGECSYSISPASRSHGSGNETGSVTVSAGTNCSWTASANVNWITVTSGFSGLGNGSVTYQVSSNSGSARTGILTIAARTFTVSQSAGSTGEDGCGDNGFTIAIGQTVNRGLDTSCYYIDEPGRYVDEYRFYASAGTQVTITLSSSVFDAYLFLIDPNFYLLAQDDDSGGGTNSRISYTLPYSGTYRIQATSYTSGQTGPYTLTLSNGYTQKPLLSNQFEIKTVSSLENEFVDTVIKPVGIVEFPDLKVKKGIKPAQKELLQIEGLPSLQKPSTGNPDFFFSQERK